MVQLLAVSRACDAFVSAVGRWASWLMLPLVAVIIVDVITRKFKLLTMAIEGFRASGNEAMASFIESYLTSTKFQDLEWHLHAALFLLCLGFAYARNSHVRIEMARDRFSTELKAWIEFVFCLVFLLPYSVLVLSNGIDFAHRAFAINEVSAALTGLSHRWIIKSFVPIGMVLLLIGLVAVLLRNGLYLFGPPEVRDQVRREAPELRDAARELREAAAREAREIAAEADSMGLDLPPADSADSSRAALPERERRGSETS